MKNLTKSVLALCVSAISFGSVAMPKTTIEHTYFATSAKQQVVGYYYQGCINGSHVEWGVRTSHRMSDPAGNHDCSRMGEVNPMRGECVLSGMWAELYGSAPARDENGDIILTMDQYKSVSFECMGGF